MHSLVIPSRLTAVSASSAASIVAAVTASRQQIRNTVIVARKHELDQPYPELDGPPLRELDDYPDRVPVYSKLYETVDVASLAPASQQLLSVRLSLDVPGLGEAGQTVMVHRSRYWHYLHPLGWASIDRRQQQEQKSLTNWRKCRVFTGPLYRLQRTLEAMHLVVPINRDAPPDSALSERHLCVAFRRYGVEMPRHAVHLPDKVPTLATKRPFKVGVQLNNLVKVSVRASLHPVTLGDAGTGLPPARLPAVEVDDWLTEMHPHPTLPEGVRVFENYLYQQGPPDFERLLGSNRTRVKK